MAIRRFALVGWFGVLLLSVVPTSCGNRGSVDNAVMKLCHPGTATCLSEQVGQICNDEGQWATFQCSSDSPCVSGACKPSVAPCTPGEQECLTQSVGQICVRDRGWVSFACTAGEVCRDGDCQASCTPATHECTATGLQRICRADGSGWDTSECPTGTSCEDGACVGSCSAGDQSCVNQRLLRQCRDDGSGYNERECPTAMSCAAGNCVANSALGCAVNQDLCLNDATALVCLRNGSGYSVTDCPSGTACRAGKCWGSACVANATVCLTATTSSTATADFNGIQTCNADGSAYVVEPCKSAGICATNADSGKAECYIKPCNVGEATCGSPTTGKTSTDLLSRCENLANGKVGWVSYKCDAPAACKSTGTNTAACHIDCSPGDQKCNSSGTAVQICNDQGAWESTPCTKGADTQDVCVLVPSTKKAFCGDKECRTLQTSTSTAAYATRGRCAGTQISKCGTDGRLGIAADCDDGQCVTDTDGLGTCRDPNRCTRDDGWRECVSSNDSYRTCMSGHWEFALCDENEQCTKLGDGLATCGNDCIENSRRCVDGGYQTCGSNGTWGATQRCTKGECNPNTSNCEVVCAPGQVRCSGDVVVASDGSSLGSRSLQTCSDSGGWGTPVACSASGSEPTYCRRSGMGQHLGCVQCVGPDVPGANEEGAPDSRCSPDGKGRQTCQADNTWPEAVTACESAEHCTKQRDGNVTGTCSSYGCSVAATRSMFCAGYETVSTPVTVDDCCSGDCDDSIGQCLHRKRHYDPNCAETTPCSTGRYAADGNPISETCCTGYCRSGQGCLKIKDKPCATVTTCSISKVDHVSVCCGSSACQTTGLCSKDNGAPHPIGEYFVCGTTASNVCWSVGSCAWTSTSTSSGTPSGAMFANCVQ